MHAEADGAAPSERGTADVSPRVLIVSASIGGGHDGAAAELSRRVVEAGGASCTVDFLDQLPMRVGHVLRRVYRLQLRYAPRTYDSLYQLWFHSPRALRPTVWAITALARRRLTRRIRSFDPTIVVSVYPLASVAIGRMRSKGWLGLPAVTYLTDFAVHPLWVHRGVDLHLAISPASAVAAGHHGAPRATLVAPLVHPRFAAHGDRAEIRARFGFADDTFAVLVVAGSWGVGSIEATVQAIARSGPFHPVCVCGRNERLGRRLERLGVGTIIGWTDQMAALMTACDAVVENAGGLTCMEAVTSGLPVITYEPIPGHGRDNARCMAEAGTVRFARDPHELAEALQTLHLSDPQAAARRATPAGRSRASDAAARVTTLASTFTPPCRPVREPRTLRMAMRCALSVVLAYALATAAFGVAAAHGLGVDRSGTDAQRATIVGIRVSASQLENASIANILGTTGVAAVIDDRIACAASQSIVDHAVTVVSSGDGEAERFAWQRTVADERDAPNTIAGCTGTRVKWFAALRRVSAFDWWYARENGNGRILAPFLVDADTPIADLAPHRLYVIDATRLDMTDALAIVGSVSDAIRESRAAALGTAR